MSSKPKMVKNGNGAGIQPPDGDGGIRLSLRVHALELEIREANWPDDAKELMQMMLQNRQITFECKYNMVCGWIKAQQYGSFWLDLGCRSLDELWARMDLPGGVALANWEILVTLFDKQTFLLVGDDELGYMTRFVASYQPDIEIRKRDYQTIFDNYCKQYPAFDKSRFRRHVNWYVNTHYVEAYLSKPVADTTKQPPRLVSKGSVQRREAVTIEPSFQEPFVGPVDGEQTLQPMRTIKPQKDFRIKTEKCAGCKENHRYMKGLLSLLAQTEEIIRVNLGAAAVPERPSGYSNAELMKIIDEDVS